MNAPAEDVATVRDDRADERDVALLQERPKLTHDGLPLSDFAPIGPTEVAQDSVLPDCLLPHCCRPRVPGVRAVPPADEDAGLQACRERDDLEAEGLRKNLAFRHLRLEGRILYGQLMEEKAPFMEED